MSLPPIESYDLPTPGEIGRNLPGRADDWTFEPARAALLVHDMQRYFVGAFEAGTEPIRSAIANIERILRSCRDAEVPVYFTAQPGRQPRERRGLQSDFWGPGMSDDETDTSIVPSLAPLEGETVIVKWRYSAFQRSNLDELLAAEKRDQLLVTGVFAHIGCLLTAADAFMRDIEPYFVADAVATFSRREHDRAVEYVAGCCGTAVATEAITARLSEKSLRNSETR